VLCGEIFGFWHRALKWRWALFFTVNCSSSINRLITSKDVASVQFNVGHVDENGVYSGQFTAFALCGFIRAQVCWILPCSYVLFLWSESGLSVERATHPPDTPDRPSHLPDKGQTGVDWPPMVSLKGQTGTGALPWTATSDCQPPRDHVDGQQ
jgi:hypothetical protein